MTARKLRILYVAYPLLPVSDESVGGAEQMLLTLEREMAARGHETVTAACEGSSLAGKVFATGYAPSEPDRYEDRAAEHETRIVEYVCTEQRAGRHFDLVHDKSGHFWKQASVVPVPVLATLHLPLHFYRQDWFEAVPPHLFFNCVSRAQMTTFADLPGMLGVVENGIDLRNFSPVWEKSDYLIWVGRICEEKGVHVAIDVAERAGVPLVIAGDVYPFSYHQNYFTREILPRLEQATVKIQFIQRPSLGEKVKLLQRARALIQPALVDETSSLVAMEAMACGTPVIAFRRGALPEVVADGETGFLIDTPDQMVEIIARTSDIDLRACRSRAETRFSAMRMAREYEELYEGVINCASDRAAQANELSTGI